MFNRPINVQMYVLYTCLTVLSLYKCMYYIQLNFTIVPMYVPCVSRVMIVKYVSPRKIGQFFAIWTMFTFGNFIWHLEGCFIEDVVY
jgi:hypothetical protein